MFLCLFCVRSSWLELGLGFRSVQSDSQVFRFFWDLKLWFSSFFFSLIFGINLIELIWFLQNLGVGNEV